jgi:hypothetical protein
MMFDNEMQQWGGGQQGMDICSQHRVFQHHQGPGDWSYHEVSTISFVFVATGILTGPEKL